MRLTLREKEILEVLKKEPLISQEELARRFGISRSSVAVHISNLMKKGVILGKGYVFKEQVSVVVIGESCLKVTVRQESDQEFVDFSYNSFASEVSKTLARFGINVKLITVIGNDDVGLAITNKLQAHKVDTVNIYIHPHRRTCRKIIVNDVVAFSEKFTDEDFAEAIDTKDWVAFNCEWLIVEDQFQELVYNRLITKDEEKLPWCCVCRYVEHPEDIPEFLLKYDLLVLGSNNLQEFDHYLYNLKDILEQTRVKECIITDGTSQIICLNSSGISHFPLPPNQSFNNKKNLHLFLAGLIYGLSSGYPMRQALRIGTGNALNR